MAALLSSAIQPRHMPPAAAAAGGNWAVQQLRAHRLTQNGLRSANNLSDDTATGPISWAWQQGLSAQLLVTVRSRGEAAAAAPSSQERSSSPLTLYIVRGGSNDARAAPHWLPEWLAAVPRTWRSRVHLAPEHVDCQEAYRGVPMFQH